MLATSPELLLNHDYLHPSLMPAVTASPLLPPEQAEASGSLRVSLLQHLHLAIRASPPSSHQNILAVASVQKATCPS